MLLWCVLFVFLDGCVRNFRSMEWMLLFFLRLWLVCLMEVSDFGFGFVMLVGVLLFDIGIVWLLRLMCCGMFVLCWRFFSLLFLCMMI